MVVWCAGGGTTQVPAGLVPWLCIERLDCRSIWQTNLRPRISRICVRDPGKRRSVDRVHQPAYCGPSHVVLRSGTVAAVRVAQRPRDAAPVCFARWTDRLETNRTSKRLEIAFDE